MQVAVEKLTGSRVSLQVEAEPERVAQAYEKAFREIRRTVPMPGFRKGKAPLQWIRRVVGGEAVDEAARELLVEDTLKEALEQEDLTPLGQSEFDYEDLKEGEAFKYTATFCVRPKIELPECKGRSVELVKAEATDEMVEEEIQGRRERMATYAPVDRPIQGGDFVDLDYTVARLGASAPAGGPRRPMSLCVGERWVQPPIDDDILGMRVGDSKTILSRFPSDHDDPDLAGETFCLDVVIRRVRERTMPEVDDEFAMRALGVDSPDEMRGELREKIAEELSGLHRESAEDRLIARLVAECEFEIPEPLVQVECRRRVALWEADLERQNLRPNELLALTGETREGLLRKARPAARYSVKRRLVLDAVAAAEGTEVSDEEIDEELSEMESQGIAVEVIRRQFEEAGALGEITDQIRQRKAAAALFQAATIVEVEELSREEKAWLEPDIRSVSAEEEPPEETMPQEVSPEAADNPISEPASTETDTAVPEAPEPGDGTRGASADGESQ